MKQREFDVVVWGATGFTGKWVAKHLYENYPQDKLRWAIAGRNLDKMDSVREFIGDTKAQVSWKEGERKGQPAYKLAIPFPSFLLFNIDFEPRTGS